MNISRIRKNRIRLIADGVLMILATVVIMTFVISAMGDASADSKDEGQRLLETSLHRAVVTCYATQGFYPPDIDYIKDNLGVIIDTEAFNVYYEIFAENVMPQITVVPVQKDKD